MKILIDPKLALLVKDFTDAQCAELLRCILEYPNRDCELGVWKFIKAQIDLDAQKYQERCDRMAANRKKHLQMISGVKEKERESKGNEIIKKENEIKGSERGNAQKIVENSVENVSEQPITFFVDDKMSFYDMASKNPKFGDYLKLFPASVVEKAETSFKKKRHNQWASMAQILEWIEKQHTFYKQNNQGC